LICPLLVLVRIDFVDSHYFEWAAIFVFIPFYYKSWEFNLKLA